MNILKLRLLAILVSVPLLYGCLAAVVGGAGVAVAVSEDRRTVGTITDDQAIELRAAARIREKFPGPHVNVTSYNRMLLLTGEAPDAATRSGIDTIARSVENVRGLYNEIAISDNTPLSARANDTFLTGQAKVRFVDQQKFNPVHVKVVTEASVVYLLGLVKHKEADDAVEIARTTRGVQKVVKLFEYLD